MALTDKTKEWIKKNASVDLTGKTVLITGANSGVGYKTAETMIYLGAAVIMACRNPVKAKEAMDKLCTEYPDANIQLMQLDLGDFASVEAFAESLPDVDVFVNNAGTLHHPNEKTKDGYPLVIGTNYFGVVKLCEAILPRLYSFGHDVMLINTISISHKMTTVDYERFYEDKGSYARSKLCLARYTNGLVERCKGTNVHVYMNHTGMAITPIAAHMFGTLYRFAKWFPINSAEKSSLSVAWLMAHNTLEGSVVGPNKIFGGWGYPEINKTCKRAIVGIKELMESILSH